MTTKCGKRRRSYGGYTYGELKLNKNWSTGFLFDYAPIVDNPSQRTLSYSPYVTWNLSEFNRLRFQYSYLSNNFSADKALNGNQFFVQWTTVIGAHTHGFRYPLGAFIGRSIVYENVIEGQNLEDLFHRCCMFSLAINRVWCFAQQIRVVATFPDLADITRQIGKELVSVESLATGVEDPHGVPVRPSFVPRLNRADVLVVTGLDDEHSWLPALLEVANNR